MCTKNLSCPLCCKSNFPNIDALRISLLKVTSRPLKCPICVDEVLGLDKLTIHLFGHSILGPEDGKPPPPPVPPPAEKKKPPTTTSQLKSVRKSRSKTQPIEPSRCGICGDEFRDQSLLQMHQSVFHEIPIRPLEEKPPLTFQCTMCPKVFKMKGSLKIHMRVVHLGSPKKAAAAVTNGTSCGGSVAVPPSDPPPAYPSSNVVHCSIPKTPPPLVIQTSLAPPPPQPAPLPPPLHHPPPAQTVTISTSPMSQPQVIKIIDPRQLAEYIYVTNQQQLQIQQQQQHQQLQQQVVERAIINATPTSSSSVPASPKDLTSNSSVPSPVAQQQPPQQQLNSPQATTPQGGADPNKQWECDVCKKSFTTKYFLKKHKRLHTGEMPYSCKICGKSFTFQQSYHKHLLYHSDDKPHVCTECGRAFKELSTLHNHERIHSGEKPFSCETCGKCFRQRVSYLVHRRIHTNTQPYKCTACDKSFRYKVSQRTHKCPAQPPGTVIRQTGDLLQKLLQSSAILPTLQDPTCTASPPPAPPSSVETVGEQTLDHDHNDDTDDDVIKSEDYINRTLDELLKESYDKMGISGDQSQLYESMDGGGSGSGSGVGGESSVLVPRIENLCLMSPGPRNDLMSFDGESMEVIDSYKLDLLYN